MSKESPGDEVVKVVVFMHDPTSCTALISTVLK